MDRETIKKVIDASTSLCLDDEKERKAIILALDRAQREWEHAHVCGDCSHLDEIHVHNRYTDEGGCHGGPNTHCDCQGFRTMDEVDEAERREAIEKLASKQEREREAREGR